MPGWRNAQLAVCESRVRRDEVSNYCQLVPTLRREQTKIEKCRGGGMADAQVSKTCGNLLP